MRLAALSLLLFTLAGCTTTPSSRQEPASPIVERLEAAGSGPLRDLQVADIQKWVAQNRTRHRDLILQVDNLCQPRRAAAQAGWYDTTEGRACEAIKPTAGFLRYKPPSDKETFQGSNK